MNNLLLNTTRVNNFYCVSILLSLRILNNFTVIVSTNSIVIRKFVQQVINLCFLWEKKKYSKIEQLAKRVFWFPAKIIVEFLKNIYYPAIRAKKILNNSLEIIRQNA